MVVPAPFDYVGEELRAKMEAASKPKEETEEDDIEGVDLMCEIVPEQWRVSPNVTSEEYFLIEHERN